jgi:hypothetical protein
MWVHRLSQVDTENRTAECANCGPVRLRKQGDKYRCAEGMKVQRRRDKIKAKYQIDWEAWEVLLIAQSGRCLICANPMTSPHVDHCHKTGEVRGLLCQTCNIGIGMFKDDPALLRAAAAYVGGVCL